MKKKYTFAFKITYQPGPGVVKTWTTEIELPVRRHRMAARIGWERFKEEVGSYDHVIKAEVEIK